MLVLDMNLRLEIDEQTWLNYVNWLRTEQFDERPIEDLKQDIIDDINDDVQKCPIITVLQRRFARVATVKKPIKLIPLEESRNAEPWPNLPYADVPEEEE